MLLHSNPSSPNANALLQAMAVLDKGGILVYPTDTVYGMGCDLFNQKAYERLCSLRGVRPEKANFSIICHDLSQLSDFTLPISNHLFRLMKKVLPGPYTFILNANNEVPKIFRNNKKTIGIRVPDNPIILELVKLYGSPIVNASVHEGDEITEYLNDPVMIHEHLGDKVDLVLAGGPGELEGSTIIDATGPEITIIREGLGPVDVITGH